MKFLIEDNELKSIVFCCDTMTNKVINQIFNTKIRFDFKYNKRITVSDRDTFLIIAHFVGLR